MYPGGKGSCYQKIINLIPPHQVYIETHLGGAAVMCHKRPAAINIGVDKSTAVLLAASSLVKNSDAAPPSKMAMAAPIVENSDAAAENIEGIAESDDDCRKPGTIAKNDDVGRQYLFVCADAVDFLSGYPFAGDEFVYTDPPYLLETRRQQRAIYEYEYTRQDHVNLLEVLRRLPCPVAISGYWSELYADLLTGWHTHTFEAQTRGGTTAVEWIWMNYPEPTALHDYSFLGDNFRERERIKRKKQRWVNRLQKLDRLERQAILWAIQESTNFDF